MDAPLTVGYAAMLEQFAPQEVVALTALAEQHGFSGCMAADHFQPWVPQQGQAAFVWNVLTAVAERTTGDLGPGVTCPSFRFHPAIVAQASATLEAIYPGRHWLGLGSGEALNEHVVGGYWPEAGERSLRVWGALEVINKLFEASLTGKDVKHAGGSSPWRRHGCGPCRPPRRRCWSPRRDRSTRRRRAGSRTASSPWVPRWRRSACSSTSSPRGR